MSTVWSGSKPEQCDICKKPITTVFIDGNTSFGGWANMCPDCHSQYGKGLGTGKGQKYNLEATTKQFVKIGG